MEFQQFPWGVGNRSSAGAGNQKHGLDLEGELERRVGCKGGGGRAGLDWRMQANHVMSFWWLTKSNTSGFNRIYV